MRAMVTRPVRGGPSVTIGAKGVCYAHAVPVHAPNAVTPLDAVDAADALAALEAAMAAIATELSIDRVLQVIVDRVRPLVDARYAALGIVDESGTMERFISSGMDDRTRAAIGHIPHGHGLLGLIIREQRAIRVPDVMTDPDRHGFPKNHPAMHSFLGVPVVVEGESVGNLYLTEKRGAPEFSERDARLVELFARHAGVAIHNARLHAAVERLAVLGERQRISQDLHDGVIQELYAVSLSLEDVAEMMTDDPTAASVRIDGAIESIHDTIGDIRRLIYGLGTDELEEVELAPGLLGLAAEAGRSGSPEVEAEVDEQVHLPSDDALQVLQLAHEALSNVTRHAAASEVRIRLSQTPEAVLMVISDDGRGFDLGVPRGAGHHGLRNMYARAASVGGTLIVRSKPGEGTRLEFRLPIAATTGAPGARP
jgi:signal transduction histidine kinase